MITAPPPTGSLIIRPRGICFAGRATFAGGRFRVRCSAGVSSRSARPPGKSPSSTRRCAHLGADLGAGCVVDDEIQCAFHNWRYDGDGRCVHIPASPDVPDFARVRSYPAVERHGFVFFFNGSDSPVSVAVLSRASIRATSALRSPSTPCSSVRGGWSGPMFSTCSISGPRTIAG